MGLVVTEERKFRHTVKVQVPVDGGHREQTCKATFRVIDADTLDEDYDLESKDGISAFLRDVLITVEDLIDDQKQPVIYDEQVRDGLIRTPFIRLALVKAYFDGVSKGRAKN